MITIEHLWREDDVARFAAIAHYRRRETDLEAAGSKNAAAIMRRARLAEISNPEPPQLPKHWYEP